MSENGKFLSMRKSRPNANWFIKRIVLLCVGYWSSTTVTSNAFWRPSVLLSPKKSGLDP